MTEEPRVFGEQQPFTLVHGDDLSEVTRFLSERDVEFTRLMTAPSLYKLQFSKISAEEARELFQELVRGEAKPRLARPQS